MTGKVYLIGAGPGDYELLTLKGHRLLKEVDVIVYDRLASSKYLSLAKEGAKLIYVGKKSSNHYMKQEDINQVLVQQAQAGKTVARLKGGDPYVFGRGGEECQELLKNNIEFEVVPGITSAIGGLCYGGIPITHRNFNSSFHVITGHLKDDTSKHDWSSIAKLNGTIVFLMGVSNLQKITDKLKVNGMDPSTDVALVQWATRSYQKVAVGNLNTIVEEVKKKDISSPSIIVVGKVVSLQKQLNFFNPEDKELYGKNIVVTRSRAQSSQMVSMLENLGARVIEAPSIRISEIRDNQLEAEFENIRNYHALIFTSSNSVKIFFDKLTRLKLDIRCLWGVKIYSMGSGTTKELNEYGLRPDFEAEKYVSESLCDKVENTLDLGAKILIPRAKKAREYMIDRLGKNYDINEIKIYENIVGDISESDYEFLSTIDIDYITFTSSSTVNNFHNLIKDRNIILPITAKNISIGPITSKTLASKGYTYIQSEKYDIDGVIDTIREDIRLKNKGV
ncbi:MAG: uroporphyrinogen-III C-methyltransferase [Firmicutes bacterium]|jgi:uroporphyrinogen III methyltransferase/synthase|nr:uroporphyrinogen-III C-methyltransferase [Bacillota bacterium]